MKFAYPVVLGTIFFLFASCHNFDYDTNFKKGGKIVVTVYTSAGVITPVKRAMIGLFYNESAMNAGEDPSWGGSVESEGGEITFTFDRDKELYMGGFYDSDENGNYNIGIDPSNTYSENPIRVENDETINIKFYIIN